MKSTQFATLLFSALLALLAGCATAEPEIESPADITVSELETKMRTAMDPDGRYAKAKTFIQRQIVSTERFLDDPEEQVVEVKFERPANFRLTTLDDNVPVSGLIVNGNNGWMVDYSGERIVELTPEQLDQLKILSGISNPDNSLTRALYKALQSSGMQVSNYGTVFMTVADKDKPEALKIARRFYNLGFNIEATSGTADYLRKHGIRTRLRRKLSEGSNDIIETLRQGHVNYVINTIDLDQHSTRLDGYEIRRTAVENNITIFTALETVRVLLDVLEEITLGISTIDAE